MGTVIRFYKMGKLIMTATINGRLGYLDGDMLAQDEVNTAHIAGSKTLDLELWHRRIEIVTDFHRAYPDKPGPWKS